MTNPPPLQHALNKALGQAIQNLFNNLISNLANPTYSSDKTTPIQRFEAGFKLALEAYEQASAVIAKNPPAVGES
jgi:hypothetical protein